MLFKLFKSLFSSTPEYEKINFNYYTDFIKELSKADAEAIEKLKPGENIRKVLKDNGKPITYVIGFPKSQQTGPNLSLYIRINYNNEAKKDFHGIFTKECGKLVNHGIREYKITGKLESGFVMFEKSDKELCYNGHGSSKNRPHDNKLVIKSK